MTLKVGDKAPNFTAPTDGGASLTLSDLHGDYVVLYFYPKDDTPGCTKEACAFRDDMSDFEKLNAKIVGVSKDTAAKHDKFKAKYDLTFPLVSDEDGAICDAYGTWVEKSMYGRKYMGIQRATFLIDPSGKIAEIWPNVKVKGHSEEIREKLASLQKNAA